MPVNFLQNWFQRQCDGFWERSHGVTLETLDTPGWLVTIDLTDTALEKQLMPKLSRERSERDWIVCEVANGQFRGQGDPQKLMDILQVFQSWAARAAPSPAE